jgi:Flp pilus assembly protein TadG
MTGPSDLGERRRCHGDDGSTYAAVILFPVVIVIFMTFVQWGLRYHAEALVNAAAQDGARAAQTQSGTRRDGEAAIAAALGRSTDSGLLTNVRTTLTVTATQVTATVSGDVPSLVPLEVNRTVYATVNGPKERLTP